MDAMAAQLAIEYPQHMSGWSTNVVLAQDDLVRAVRPLVSVLFGVTVIVLLVAGANVANLQLGRATRRAPEMAVRAALGAGRGRLLGQLITESGLLAVAGGLGGLALAWTGLPALLAVAPPDLPRLEGVAINGTVLAWTSGVTLVIAVLIGLVPALRISRTGTGALVQQARVHSDRRHNRLRHGLVAAQLAMTLVLLIGAALLARSVWNLQAIDVGFEPERVLAVSIDLPSTRYADNASHIRFYEELQARLRALPGVEQVAGTTAAPGVGGGMTFSFAIEGRPSTNPTGREDPVPLQAVTLGYFDTMSIPIRQGRSFDRSDREDGPPVVAINEALARRHWPDGDAVGRRIRFRDELPWREIVGIVGDTRDEGRAQEAPPTLYIPFAQKERNWLWMSWQTLLVRVPGNDPLALLPHVRQVVLEQDARLPVLGASTFEEAFSATAAGRRSALQLVAGFAGLALLLGVIGVYSVMAYAVGERRQEIGIRMALGARPRQVAGAVVRPTLGYVVAGVTLGIAGAVLLAGFLEALLYGVAPSDPMTFAIAVTLLAGIAAVAAWVPARRAMTVSPVDALRLT